MVKNIAITIKDIKYPIPAKALHHFGTQKECFEVLLLVGNSPYIFYLR